MFVPAHFQCFHFSLKKGISCPTREEHLGLDTHWLMTFPRLSEAIIKMICQAAMVYKQTRSKFALTFFTFYLLICGVHVTTTCMEVRGLFLKVSVPHSLTNRGCQAWQQAPLPTAAVYQSQRCFLCHKLHTEEDMFLIKRCAGSFKSCSCVWHKSTQVSTKQKLL